MMNREVGFAAGINQDFWLAPVIDRLLLGGICMALVYEWAMSAVRGDDPANLMNDLFDQSGGSWQRKLSFQRAYDFTWYDHGRRQAYPAFHNTLETATSRFLPQQGRHDKLNITRVFDTPNRDICRLSLNNTAVGRIYMLMIDGDGNPREENRTWGHVVGVGVTPHPSPGRARYFDPNTGLYYMTDRAAIGDDVVGDILSTYRDLYHLNVRGYVLYRVTLR